MAGLAMGGALARLHDLFEGGSVVGLDDARLLARWAESGDEPAFEALVARHGPMVWATCRSVLRHRHDAEDAFQATFLVLTRKAGSVRRGDALGPWLHRVATRAAVQADAEGRKRRRKEAEAAPDRPSAAPDPTSADELKAVLHQEIDRLPEARRLPVLLCDLEGLTYDEAARRLRWTPAAVRSRLARGRQALRDRLARRGFAAPLALPIARHPLPEALARSVVGPGTFPPAATALARAVLGGMLRARVGVAGLVLAVVGIGSAGVVAALGRGEAIPPPLPTASGPIDPPPAASNPAFEPVEIRGVVVGPDGRPVAGATVAPGRDEKADGPVPEARTAADGRFAIRLAWSSRRIGLVDPETFPSLIASHPDFGPGWAKGVLRPGGVGDLTIRLAAGGPPIEGRIVDLEGRPVAGARVKVKYLLCPEGGRDLSDWLADARAASVPRPWKGLEFLPSDLAASTGADGRFAIGGVGRERVARLIVQAPSLVATEFQAMTREGEPVRIAAENLVDGPTPIVVQANHFTLPVAPCKPVRGVIRDRDTGRPLPGLRISGTVFRSNSLVWDADVESITDSEGRYALPGMARADAYRLFVFAHPASGYPGATIKAPAISPGIDPVDFDIRLKRGVVIRGRVTDRSTRAPVAGYVNVYSFVDNPGLADFPDFRQSMGAFAYLDAEGRYEAVAPPGRTVLACRSDMARYRKGVGAESIRGYSPAFTNFQTYPSFRGAVNYHILKEVDLAPNSGPVTADLQVEPGGSLEIAAIDPEGRPIGDLRVAGAADMGLSQSSFSGPSTFAVRSLAPGKPRRVTVTHEARKLAGSFYLHGHEARPITLPLAPWAELKGRIVDDEGKPRPGLGLYAAGVPGPVRPQDIGVIPGGNVGGGAQVDREGRFRLVGLVPGLTYGADASDGLDLTLGDLFRGVVLKPGEVRDLGDLKVTPLSR